MRKRTTTRTPPSHLSAEGKTLWRATVDEYAFDSEADFALLRQLCESIDGARACRKRIAKDGLLVAGSTGQPRPHPLLNAEAEYRRATLACVRALRLTTAPEF